jgi:hypothetical protein
LYPEFRQVLSDLRGKIAGGKTHAPEVLGCAHRQPFPGAHPSAPRWRGWHPAYTASAGNGLQPGNKCMLVVPTPGEKYPLHNPSYRFPAKPYGRSVPESECSGHPPHSGRNNTGTSVRRLFC